MTIEEKDSGHEEDSLHYVQSTEDLEENERVIVDVNEREVVVVRKDGELHAFSNYCPHQGGPLGEGIISGQFSLPDGGNSISDLTFDCESSTISCPWHGWSFELEGGDHVTEPKFRIPTYEVIERDGNIYLSLE